MDQAQQLRNIIKQQNMQQHLARVITVTSGKGGVGDFAAVCNPESETFPVLSAG